MKKEGARYPGPPDPFSSMFSQAAEALPGEYKIKITIGAHSDSQMVKILSDPNMLISEADFNTNLARKDRYQTAIGKTTETFNKIDKAGKSIQKLIDFISDREDEKSKGISDSAKKLSKQIDSLRHIATPKPSKGIAGDTDDLVTRLQNLGMYFFSSMTAPAQAEEEILAKLEEDVEAYAKSIDSFIEKDLKAFQEELKAAGLGMLTLE